MCHVKVTGGAGVVIGGAHICPFQPIFTFCFEPINISLPIGQPGEGGRGGNGTFCNGIIRLPVAQFLSDFLLFAQKWFQFTDFALWTLWTYLDAFFLLPKGPRDIDVFNRLKIRNVLNFFAGIIFRNEELSPRCPFGGETVMLLVFQKWQKCL